MAWNEPGNNNDKNGRENDPWGDNRRSGQDKGPPDLDEVFNKLSRKITGKFGKSSNGGHGNKGGLAGIGIVAAVAVVVWGVSGFYTIGEAERGVVLRLGQYNNQVVEPGLNWRPRFIDTVTPVNVQAIRSLRADGLMLTKDENVVTVAMDVQYKVADPYKYLYQVTNADDSLRQATDSALRAVIGDSLMDSILTSGRQEIRQRTQETLNQIIDKYDMGLVVVDVNFQSSRPPEQVKDAFDDAIAAREDEARFIREAEAYKNEILPKATGRAERVKKEASGYSERVVNKAQGQVAQFEKLLPEYLAAPEVTRNRLYLDTMEKIYSRSSKVLIDSDSTGNLLYLPFDKLTGHAKPKANPAKGNKPEEIDANINFDLQEHSSSDTNQSTDQTSSSTTRQGRF